MVNEEAAGRDGGTGCKWVSHDNLTPLPSLLTTHTVPPLCHFPGDRLVLMEIYNGYTITMSLVSIIN